MGPRLTGDTAESGRVDDVDVPADLTGRKVVVTGAARGLGRASAMALAGAGADIILSDIDAAALEAVVAELRHGGHSAHGVPADVTDPASLAHLMGVVADRTGGHLDVLVANVGVMFDHDLADVSLSDWNRCLELNLTSVMLTFQAGLPLLERSDAASMIAMSSGAGFNRQTLAGIAYASAKAGVAQLVRVLGTRLGPSGIRVNAVAPGIADTPMTHDLVGADVGAVEARIPLRRLGDPAEIANAVLFLASPMSSYVNGQILHVSGGV